MSDNGRTQIVILGGGFGSVYTAIHLEKQLAHEPNVDITLVNRDNFFLFTPMLHEVAASDLDITHIVNPIRKLLHRASFFEGDVEYVDLPNKCGGVSPGYEPHPHELP
jgi:NADH dehydrogenase